MSSPESVSYAMPLAAANSSKNRSGGGKNQSFLMETMKRSLDGCGGARSGSLALVVNHHFHARFGSDIAANEHTQHHHQSHHPFASSASVSSSVAATAASFDIAGSIGNSSVGAASASCSLHNGSEASEYSGYYSSSAMSDTPLDCGASSGRSSCRRLLGSVEGGGDGSTHTALLMYVSDHTAVKSDMSTVCSGSVVDEMMDLASVQSGDLNHINCCMLGADRYKMN